MNKDLVNACELSGILGGIKVFRSTSKEDKINGEYFSVVMCAPNKLYGDSSVEAEGKALIEAQRYLTNQKDLLQEDLSRTYSSLEFIAKKIENNHTPQINAGEVN